MIRKMQLRNWKCLNNIELELRPLNVLIGPNNTGKSTFLDALKRISELPTNCNKGNIASIIAAYRRNGNGELHPSFSLWSDEQIINSMDVGVKEKRGFWPCQVIRLGSRGIPTESPVFLDRDLSQFPDIQEDGSGLAALLDFLLRRDRIVFDALVNDIVRRVKGLVDIHINRPEKDRVGIVYTQRGGYEFDGSNASVGLKIITFFVALSFHPHPPRLILLEEPENGVHPARLKEIVQLLRDLTTGERVAHPAQIIITTHSPYLLDFIDPIADGVFVFSRDEENVCTAKPIDLEEIQPYIGDFLLGEIWSNLELDKEIEGQP